MSGHRKCAVANVALLGVVIDMGCSRAPAPPAPVTPAVRAQLRTQIPGRDLSRIPPEVQELSVEPLSSPQSEGNARLRVRFADGEPVPPRLSFDAGGQLVTLTDDGTGADEQANDRVFSSFATVNVDELRANTQRLAAARTSQPVDVFRDRRKAGREFTLDIEGLRPGRRFPFVPVGNP